MPCETVGVKIPAMLLSPAGVGSKDRAALSSMVSICAIYFHPNAVDIGDCLEDMEAICDGAYGGDAVVIAPEYPGYGLLNEFEPSVEGLDLAAEAAWQYCVQTLGFSGERVMLWGRSIGCGPAASLAYRISKGLINKRAVGSTASVMHDPPPRGTFYEATEPDLPPSPPPRSVSPSPATLTPRHLHALSLDDFRRSSARPNQPISLPRPHPTPRMLMTSPRDRQGADAFEDESLATVGALVMIAPYISISAVVQHHTASPFLASVVGPMWEVLEIVKDECMKEVPLCILHPKEDEIIPSQHGLQIFQQALCRKKYGVWLSNATHNFQPEEDHFTLVKAFLTSVAASRGVVPPFGGAPEGKSSGIVASSLMGGGPDSAAGTSSRDVQEAMDKELEALAARMLGWGELDQWSAMSSFTKESTGATGATGASSEPAEQKTADAPVAAESDVPTEAIPAQLAPPYLSSTKPQVPWDKVSVGISSGGAPAAGDRSEIRFRPSAQSVTPVDVLGAVAAGAVNLDKDVCGVPAGRRSTSATL